MKIKEKQLQWLGIIFVYMFIMVGCSTGVSEGETAVLQTSSSQHEDEHEHDDKVVMLTLPELEAIELNGEALKVVATTSLVGDIVAQIGGGNIELTTLMEAGQDPHSFEPAARDMTAVAQADVIFVNGWDLEEALVQDLEEIGEEVLFVPISANIEPLLLDERDDGADHDHGDVDPHVWLNVRHVKQWAENVANVLIDLDPANETSYEANTAVYLAELDMLEAYTLEQVAQIPVEKRLLVTNHDSFGYFAQAYGFELIGTVIPAGSTLAEPSANALTGLIEKLEERGVCTIFTETTANDSLAQTVTAELASCDEVQVVQLYTGAIGPANSGTDSYIGMFRANVDAIVEGLQAGGV